MKYAVILAGGKGLRLGGDIPKQLLPLCEKSVIRWSVESFSSVDEIDHIIIVAEKHSLETIKSILPPAAFPKILGFVEGGAERSDSSYNALCYKEFNSDDIFLFHDAARPFVTKRIIRETIAETVRTGAAGVYIPAVDTVTLIENDFVSTIPERKDVYYAQTPQGFRYSIIRDAHEKHRSGSLNIKVTDDVSLVLASGYKVHTVSGSVSNFKITTELDYKIAEFIGQNGLYK